MTNFLSDFISAYRKGYSTNYALLRLIENWRAALYSNLFTGTVLMDLSKAFDCIPHDLLIAKLHAYGFSFETLTFLNSYLRNRKQCVKINNICSDFLKKFVRCTTGLYTRLHNFGDDNTITAVCDQLADLIKILKADRELSVEWFRVNKMVVNSRLF